ncbi:MAG: peptidase T [Spirochaetales bacterium]|nr:peptidase T [Spirochaetales bacterium]MCF7938830.1 peptidase T [Spirochaetales bacterium]
MSEIQKYDETELSDDLVNRFIRYARIYTTSERNSDAVPSTPGQLELLDLLQRELEGLGVSDVFRDPKGFLIARVPERCSGEEDGSAGAAASGRSAAGGGQDEAGGAADSEAGGGQNEAGGGQNEAGDRQAKPALALLAHVDTAMDAPGLNVKPRVHRDYDGGRIELAEGLALDPATDPDLAAYHGRTLISSDGTTLLGADDKAGVAEIMSVLTYLRGHPELSHPAFEVVFTTDEETGEGINRFPRERLEAPFALTLDGGAAGMIDFECFTAYSATVEFTGCSAHPGDARGVMVNAVRMAGAYLSMLPANESPEATDGRYGFYHPMEVSGDLERARVDLIVRDFEEEKVRQRLESLERFAEAVEAAFPGGQVAVTVHQQYRNMRETVEAVPGLLERLQNAVRAAGLEPRLASVRGGTDGARLTAMGLPCPNLFSGARNMHSRREWVPVPDMVKASVTVLELLRASRD